MDTETLEKPPAPMRTADINPDATLHAAIEAACARIAPLWPLKHFVAVNPFLGLSDKTFAGAAAWLDRVARADMLMPIAFYRQKIDAGMIGDTDLEAALAVAPSAGETFTVASIRQFATRHEETTRGGVVATVAEVLDRLADGDRYASRTAFMVEEISRWCAAYFDEGQAAWKAPWRNTKPYAAWREAMRHDRNPEVMGVRDFRRTISSLPAEPAEAIGMILRELAIPEQAFEDYLFRALFDIQGWAAYARYRVWQSQLDGKADDTLAELLAIRVAWGYALFQERSDDAFRSAWAEAMNDARRLPEAVRRDAGETRLLRVILQEAYERAFQRRLLRQIRTRPVALPQSDRPAVQAAFCIDVRSEVYRRALESVSDDVETIGFAGFFGFPIEYVPIGNTTGGAQCPVLLKPSVVVCEAVEGADRRQQADILARRLLRRRAGKAWKAFKQSAVSSFTFVETMGLGFAGKILGDSLGWTRPVPDPNREGLDRDLTHRLAPQLEMEVIDRRSTGFASSQRVDMAEAVLRAMSMTSRFARLVLLTGHGSTTVNNPHASSLDCGACGGHTGEANARVAAAILNDTGVRTGLASRGIAIPADTWFLGCLHDTTTDQIRIFNEESVPPSHEVDLRRLREWLGFASARARQERSRLLGLAPEGNVDARIVRRSRDWSQVRPEWGLAGNAAFIAAPRERTTGSNFGGRTFLHNYDWRIDHGFGTLELIMTAPMVVASWINLQYYGSSVNNRVFGSGNKTLHNVVGALGVLEGNGGDLRTGLPMQSVHDGRELAHEPLRLSVIIEAPLEAINTVISRHEMVRQLVENRWLHLFALGPDGKCYRYWGGGTWASQPSQEETA